MSVADSRSYASSTTHSSRIVRVFCRVWRLLGNANLTSAPVSRMPHEPERHIDWQLFDRYLAGQCVPDEVARVEQWMTEGGTRGAYVSAVRETYAPMQEPAPWTDAASRDSEMLWERVRDRTTALAPDAPALVLQLPHPKAPRRRMDSRIIIAGIAATLVLATGLGVSYVRRQPGTNSIAQPATREFRTTRGQRATMQLSDGTRVLLGPDSRLLIPLTFGTGTRDVRLEGQGYFEVVHEAARPFRVLTRHAVVEDIGTAFVVDASGVNADVRVAVKEGVVAFGAIGVADTNRTILRADMAGQIDAEGRRHIERHTDLDADLAWTTGRLLLRRVTLREALPLLERWYDIHLHVTDAALLDRHLTIDFRNQTERTALEAVALLVDGRVEWNNRTVTLFRARKTP